MPFMVNAEGIEVSSFQELKDAINNKNEEIIIKEDIGFNELLNIDYNVTIDAEYLANHTSYVEYCLNGNYYYVYNHDMDSLRTFLSSVEIDTTYQQTENHYVVLKKDYGSCTIYLYI